MLRDVLNQRIERHSIACVPASVMYLVPDNTCNSCVYKRCDVSVIERPALVSAKIGCVAQGLGARRLFFLSDPLLDESA